MAFTAVFFMPSMNLFFSFLPLCVTVFSLTAVIKDGKWILIALPLDSRYYRRASKGD